MSEKQEEVVESPDVHFDPIVKLAPVETKTLEEDEEEVFKMRAKLFRFDTSADPPEWKERGTGEVKFLRHRKSEKSIRLLMRRDKTHKICANHYLTADMKLQSSAGSDRAWVWTVQADFADEEAKVEQLAIRFKNAENANKFKDEFDKYKAFGSVTPNQSADEDKLTEELDKLKVEDDQRKDAESGEKKLCSDSAPSGEGVKEETSQAAGDDTKKADEAPKSEEPQETKSPTE